MASTSAPLPAAAYQPDVLGPDFEQLILPQPADYEGPARAVLVRCRPGEVTSAAKRAVLYVHGFNDYFFQQELALECTAHGYGFYALDLRKYGRALLPHQQPNTVRHLREYYPDLDAALAQLHREGYMEVVLMGHSTGGLITALFTAHRRPPQVKALVLNSPFLELHQSWLRRHVAVPAAVAVGAVWPTLPLPAGLPDTYGQSLHRAYRGHWDYNLAWKPNHVFPVNAGWLRAIRRGQGEVKRGLQLPVPVLVLHSDRTATGRRWQPDFQRTDIVLNVADIRRLAPRLGSRVTVQAVAGAVHDVFLSAPEARARAYQKLFAWLATVPTPVATPQ